MNRLRSLQALYTRHSHSHRFQNKTELALGNVAQALAQVQAQLWPIRRVSQFISVHLCPESNQLYLIAREQPATGLGRIRVCIMFPPYPIQVIIPSAGLARTWIITRLEDYLRGLKQDSATGIPKFRCCSRLTRELRY